MTPTLNEYTEKDGYYIQTLLPEVGYVTYKVTPEVSFPRSYSRHSRTASSPDRSE